MTVKEAYRLFKAKLLPIYSDNESENISRMIFESLAGTSRSDMLMYPNKILNTETNNKLEKALVELMNFKPVQYVIGHCWFYNLSFKVNEEVLIPRPETEELVTAVIHFLKNKTSKKLLDIGSGSGCIPISIKKNIPETEITSVDISHEALIIAKENALKNQTEIDFIELDFLNEKLWSDLGTFEIIVSNPPYIPHREYAEIDNQVKLFEPSSALFVPDEQPLLFYEKIASFCTTHLSKDGKIFLEIHEQYGSNVCELFSSNKFETELIKDMYGKDRIVVVTPTRKQLQK